MKCPKCGYNSFEFHHTCKKCSCDLTSYKVTYGLKEIVLTQEARSSMAVALKAETAVGNKAPETVAEAATDMFSFDLPDENASVATATASDNLFDFGEEPVATELQGFGEFSFDAEQKSAQAKAEEEAFADLLESSSQNADTAVAPAPSPGEFDLNNFSWDDTPATSAATGSKPEDNFNSLFGELDNATMK
jgi:predicted  nucleic acid-binding Zn-ribbon protein